MTSLRQRMLEDPRIRNYSPSTVRCYVHWVAEFAKYFHQSPDHLGPEEIRAWQLFLLNEKGLRISSYIQAVCGLRFFCRTTLNRKIEIERIPFPQTREQAPSHSEQGRGQSAAGGSQEPWPPDDSGHHVCGGSADFGSGEPESRRH